MLQDFLATLQITSKNVIKLGLENITKAAQLLNLPKPAPYIVVVGGTNGKGSVINLLDAALVSLGYKTGCYTSPHLVNFNERYRVNQKPLNDQELLTNFQSLLEKINYYNLTLTFFEFITLAAWSIYSTKDLDILLLEIGLGGRLDAVNAIPKDLAIITSVAFDHQDYLGNTLEDIGREKSGIISNNTPVILGDLTMPEVIFKIAQARNATIFQYGKDYNLKELGSAAGNKLLYTSATVTYYFSKRRYLNLCVNNIATSIKALELILKSRSTKPARPEIFKSIDNTIKNFNLLGRCSWLNPEKTILIDVAHNEQSIENLKNYLIKINSGGKKILAVFGMLQDKNIEKCLAIIEPIIHYWYLSSINEARGTQAEHLANIIKSINNKAEYQSHENITECFMAAYKFVTQNLSKDSILIVFGSFHIVGPVCKCYGDL
ncbi:MAG: hypothetical protein KBD64_01795 [Gammaproteobacteria bacterium]|nr:hypothetical protein [Gammaproteobacteria bacterium]